MKEEMEKMILGEIVRFENDYLDIEDLRFLKDNPRVYACIYGVDGFDGMIEQEQQKMIYEKLMDEPSVKALLPEIKRHGGLMESILVRHETKEVIEGNSRLAVYRYLKEKNKDSDNWDLIPCEIIHQMNDELQDAFLSQIHVKGKTQWSAYEKANFAYVRKQRGWGTKKIAKVFGESEPTIGKRINVIKRMKKNEDKERSHFSYYNVLVRFKTKVRDKIEDSPGLEDKLLRQIKGFDSGRNEDDESENKNEFTAKDLRDKLPDILDKPKVMKKYMDGKLSFDDAYQEAKISDVENSVKRATSLIEDITKKEVDNLKQNRIGAFKQVVRKFIREAERVNRIVFGDKGK